ncbi:MAG: metallopeptidase TldD-related protein [Nocardioidaceae bacterium]
MTSTSTPQELVERALTESDADDCFVIVDEGSSANLRWANNTLTTNGESHARTATVVSFVGGTPGRATAPISRTARTLDDITDLVHAADAAARDAGPAPDAAPLADGQPARSWDEEPDDTTIGVFGDLAPALGDVLARAVADDRVLYGYAEHAVTTSYVGSSTGVRLRHVQPGGHIGITGKDTDLSRSAWVGRATRDFADVDVNVLGEDLRRRLGWAERSVDLPAGRYDTVLPPAAVADLMIYAYWTATAREAYEGQTVFGRAGGGTRIGDRLTDRPVRVWSDPDAAGLECAPFVLTRSSGSAASVFDNAMPSPASDWVTDGVLRSLVQTRETAALTGQPFTPGVDNLLVSVDGADGNLDDLVSGVDHGLLLTCLWYIREVDPQNLLLTGLTRDGVYLVENGEVTGAVNNFRFNESPIDLLGRIGGASATENSFSREWGDEFLRTSTPALRVPDFNMSTVSQAR